MKKKLVSTILTTAMIAGMLSGCGGSTENGAADTAPAQDAEAQEETPADDSSEAQEETPAEDTADAASSGEAVTLKWAIWDKDITPYWNAIKEGYEAANPNVTIDIACQL